MWRLNKVALERVTSAEMEKEELLEISGPKLLRHFIGKRGEIKG